MNCYFRRTSVEPLLEMNDSTGRMELSLAAATSRWRVQNSHRGSDLTARMTQADTFVCPENSAPNTRRIVHMSDIYLATRLLAQLLLMLGSSGRKEDLCLAWWMCSRSGDDLEAIT